MSYGIGSVSEYVENASWLSKRNDREKEGFDIFEDVTKWSDEMFLSKEESYINVINRNESKFRNFLAKNNISTDMILTSSRKILWRHGQCLSFEPAKLVRLCPILYFKFVFTE